jgi:DNA-binding transcriptional ArsR family regulator
MRSSQSRSAKKKAANAKAANVTPISFSADMAKLQGNAQRACDLLKAMANPARLMVLCQIAHGEKSVGELERAVGLSQSGLSQHLAVLRGKKLVNTRRDAQTIYYSLASAEAATVMATLYDMYCGKAGAQPATRLRARVA